MEKNIENARRGRPRYEVIQRPGHLLYVYEVTDGVRSGGRPVTSDVIRCFISDNAIVQFKNMSRAQVKAVLNAAEAIQKQERSLKKNDAPEEPETAEHYY